MVPESRLWNEAHNATESFRIRQIDESPRFIPVEGLAPFIPGPELLEGPDHITVELP